MFMEWIGCMQRFPMPKAVKAFDAELEQFLLGCMLVSEPVERHTLQQCLTHPFVIGPAGSWQKLSEIMPDIVFRDDRGRLEDHGKEILHQGTLWKLAMHADPMDIKQWFARDTWMTPNGNLCYYSQKEGKRLILLDAGKLHRAVISMVTECARDHAFQILIPAECQGEPDEVHIFACKSPEELATWSQALKREADGNTHTIISAGLVTVHELQRFRLQVRNRRIQLPRGSTARDQFEPVLKTWLWKLKFEGDPHIESHWYERKVWLSKNGSLVYWSPREDRELVYHTSAEIARVSVFKLGHSESCKVAGFRLVLPANGDLDYAPSFFACNSLERREEWMRAFKQFTNFSRTCVEEGTQVGRTPSLKCRGNK